ncbi:MFS transporter [Sinomonas sp. ASV322]|uniref:MFS transporter n=1 Tax=Sinomonas sp. ASV322 TaxID=3041920 RepID=UPI0027DD02EE|nr:MFS transporter [Sinomonas sp. ASV322]MDQ4501538.1 MFS transporter [Sinomonas sp. ASV322]
MTGDPKPFTFRSIALPVFLPALLFATGEGAILPIIPITAHNLGASLALAGLVSSMVTVGTLTGDLPSGAVVSRLGERRSMIVAAFVALGGIAVCLLAANPWVLLAGVFLVGLATAVFALARHAFMTTHVPLRYRARALSTLGGVFRGGWFLGPLIASAVIAATGTPQSAFWIFAAACALAATSLLVLPDPERAATGAAGAWAGSRAAGPGAADGAAEPGAAARPGAQRTTAAREPGHGLFRAIRTHRTVLVRMGSGAALVGAARSARITLLPLWALSIGLGEANTALVIGIAGGVEFALFYTSGHIMDRWGRLWSVMPCMLGLGAGFLTLAFLHDVPGRAGWFVAVVLLLSVANGLGSGIIMTLGADLAPRTQPASFLGAWRFASDGGQAAAPLLVSGLTAVASLAFASGTIGVLALLGAGILARYVPRYVPHRRRAPSRASELADGAREGA